MNDHNFKQDIIKFTAIVAVVISTVLLQAQSSQAIPLDGVLDSAAKAFVQRLLGLPVDQPEEPKENPATTESPDVSAPEAISTDIVEQN
jgi:hypothetical protein